MSSVQDKNRADELFAVAYDECYSLIYRFVASRLKSMPSNIEDCVQDVFVALYKNYLNGVEIHNAKAFLLKTANNYVHKYYEKYHRDLNSVEISENVDTNDTSIDIDDKLVFEQYSRQISAALNEKDAELFSLRFVEELKICEISDITGMSIPAITTRISRMKPKLQKLLESIISS